MVKNFSTQFRPLSHLTRGYTSEMRLYTFARLVAQYDSFIRIFRIVNRDEK